MSQQSDDPIPRDAKGRFPKGYTPSVRRRKGSKNKVPASVKEAMARAAKELGAQYAEGDPDVLKAFFVRLGQQKIEALAGHLVHGSVPRATTPEEDKVSGALIDTINIVSIPSGEFVCDFAEAEVYRKLKSFPGLLEPLLALMNAALFLEIPAPVEMSTSDAALLERMARLPGATTGLRRLLVSYLNAAEEMEKKRQERAAIEVPLSPDLTNVTPLHRPPAA